MKSADMLDLGSNALRCAVPALSGAPTFDGDQYALKPREHIFKFCDKNLNCSSNICKTFFQNSKFKTRYTYEIIGYFCIA